MAWRLPRTKLGLRAYVTETNSKLWECVKTEEKELEHRALEGGEGTRRCPGNRWREEWFQKVCLHRFSLMCILHL